MWSRGVEVMSFSRERKRPIDIAKSSHSLRFGSATIQPALSVRLSGMRLVAGIVPAGVEVPCACGRALSSRIWRAWRGAYRPPARCGSGPSHSRPPVEGEVAGGGAKLLKIASDHGIQVCHKRAILSHKKLLYNKQCYDLRGFTFSGMNPVVAGGGSFENWRHIHSSTFVIFGVQKLLHDSVRGPYAFARHAGNRTIPIDEEPRHK